MTRRQKGVCIVEVLEKPLNTLLMIIRLEESRVEVIRICVYCHQWEFE